MSRAKTLETYRRLFDSKSPPMCPNCEKPLKKVLIEKIKTESLAWNRDLEKYYPIESIENYELLKVYCEHCGKSVKDETAQLIWRKWTGTKEEEE